MTRHLGGLLSAILLFWSFTPCMASQSKTEKIDLELTQVEQEWLTAHPIITLGPDPLFHPIEFFNEKGEYKGIAADYLALVEKKLGIKFKIVQLKNWGEAVKQAKSRQIDAWVAATKSPQRSKYMLFTKPHIELPGVMIVKRGDYEKLTMDQLKGLRVAVVSNYIWQDFIKNDYPGLKLDLVPDIQTGLKRVSLGSVDVFINDLATASYFIEQEGLTNLSTAGDTGYFFRLAFASRSDWPELNSILDKGLAQISPSEKIEIYRHWVHLGQTEHFSQKELVHVILLVFVVIAVLVAGFFVWTRTLRSAVKRRTAELNENNKKLTAIMDNIDIGISLISPQMTVLEINRAMQCWFPNARIPERPTCFKSLKNPRGSVCEFCPIAKSFADGRVHGATTSTEIGATTRHFHIVASPIKDESGQVTSVVEIVDDITEKKIAETTLREAHDLLEKHVEERTEELEHSKNKYLELFENANDIVYTIDLKGAFTSANRMAEQVSGYSCEEIMKMNITQIIAPEHILLVREKIADKIKGAKKTVYEIDLITKDNRRVPIEVSSRLIFHKGQPVGSQGICRDITERKQMEERLIAAKEVAEAANRAKSDFLANMSHELRTPLNGILGFSEILLGTDISADQRKKLELIKYSGDNLLILVNDVLDLSKIESGEFELKYVTFSLRELVDKIVEQHAGAASAKGLEFVVSIDDDIPGFVVGDPDRLRQVILNLLSNAIKFTSKGAVFLGVEVTSVTDNLATIHFYVKDSGIGIPLERQNEIFNRFTQADSSTTREYGGTGLGTTISRELVELMGGKIWLESVPEKGSTFHFTGVYETKKELVLPEPGSLQENVERPKGETKRKQLSILLVEDNRVNQELTMSALGILGHKVVLAKNGREAVEKWEEGIYDLILMDVQMPEMDGFTATKLIREMENGNTHIPIVAMTARVMEGDKEKCFAAGMDDYLSKPISMSPLVEKLAQFM